MPGFALLATITSCALSALAGHIPAHGHRHELAKRDPGELAKRGTVHTNSRLTYYYTNDGTGACGDQVHDYQYIVALNMQELGYSYPSPNCNRYITIQHGGKSVTAQIKDGCPGCPWGGLDLTPTTFWALTSVDTPILDATWWYNDDPPAGTTTKPSPTPTPTPTPTTTWTPPTTTSKPKPTTTSTPPPPPTTSSSTWTPPTTTSTSTMPSSTSTSSSTHSTHSSSSSSSHSSAARSTDASASTAGASSTSSGAAAATAVANAGDGSTLGAMYQAVIGMGGVAAAGAQAA